MGAFGPPDSLAVAIFGPLFSFLGKSSAGSVYSFGYTLLMGVIGNMVIGVYASRAMLKGASKLKCFRSAWWYGGKRNV